VRLEGITKRFGKVVAIDNVTLRVTAGEFMVLVGPSGCGKTTLLRMIAGLEEPDEGDIFIDDEWVNRTQVGRRNVQMIFQNYALWPHMRVLDERGYSNITFPLKVRGWSREQIAERVRDVARRVGLSSELFDRKPDTLSGGERQRVALARAMTPSPRVFLMDEPMSSLDPPARVKMRYEVRRIHDELGATTIFVTHNMSDAYVLADRIALMRDGQIVQVGTAQSLRQHPKDEFVREYMGS
jgi:multiple sugar transport system ATP-binding protein